MLSALTEKQEMVYLTHELSKERLLEIRQTQHFYCPACHEQLVLKIGQVMIPHFAHRKNEHCQVFSEGESALHLQGKYAL
ncbi:MAG: competence protein CoiA, partial [Kurthia sp.]|nr:competence protein CoiA [Kurthia sp.]